MSDYTKALKKAIRRYEVELVNMKQALLRHEQAEADVEIIRQTKGQAERRSVSEGAKRP